MPVTRRVTCVLTNGNGPIRVNFSLATMRSNPNASVFDKMQVIIMISMIFNVISFVVLNLRLERYSLKNFRIVS